VWNMISLDPITSGCPNRCRHCLDGGGPPFGALMSLDELKWVVGEFSRISATTFGTPLPVRAWPDGLEPTVHPDFLRMHAYCRSTFTREWRGEATCLSSNGYGIARATDYPALFAQLKADGVSGVGWAFHGLEEEHDWFVRRRGAFQDLVTAVRRSLECGMRFNAWVSLNNRNVSSLPALVDTIEELIRAQEDAKLIVQVAGYFSNDRLRAFEALRPTAEEIAPQADLLARCGFEAETEAACVAQLARLESSESLTEVPEVAGAGPEERALGRLRISPEFEVTETFWTRPSLAHGNLKRDGIERVWRSILTTAVPEIPAPSELARCYGGAGSAALHYGPGSVYVKLCDAYWQEQGVDVTQPRPGRPDPAASP
jgi:MoaA/NifB/PqqE/SkfB family radical SAM enzyme